MRHAVKRGLSESFINKMASSFFEKKMSGWLFLFCEAGWSGNFRLAKEYEDMVNSCKHDWKQLLRSECKKSKEEEENFEI